MSYSGTEVDIKRGYVVVCNFVEDGAQKVIADKTITKTHLLLIVNLLILNVVNILKPDC